MRGNEYLIVCGEAYQHRVRAFSATEALHLWLDNQGYETIEAAARENYCGPEDIKAILVGTEY